MSSSTAEPTAEDAPSADSAPAELSAEPQQPADPESLADQGYLADPESVAGPESPDGPEQPADPESLADLESPDGPEPVADPEQLAEGAPPDALAGPIQRPPYSTIAVAALPAGILPLVPVGIGLGIAGLVTTRRGRRRGRELAVTGLLASITWLGIGAAVATVGVLTHGFHRVTRIEYNYTQAAVFSLHKGNCIQNPDASTPSLVSCSAPHAAEVFATFTLPRGSWPGTAAVQQDAREGCSSRLAGYLNPQLAISLSQDYVYPGQVDWQAGTRTIICEVRATTGQLTQSVKGAS